MFKILKKIIIIFSCILLFVILSVVIIHEIFITPEFVKSQVVKIFTKTFNKDIKLEKIDISIFKGVAIDNLTLYNPKYSSKRVFFRIKKLRFKYNFIQLCMLKFKIDEIIIDNPYIFLEYNENLEKWNFSDYILASKKKEKKKKKNDTPFKIDIDLRKFVVKNFTLEFIKGFYFKLAGINYSARFKIDEASLKGVESIYFNFFNTGNKNIIFQNKTAKIIMPLNLNAMMDVRDNNKKGKFLLTYNLKDALVELDKKFYALPDINVILDSNIIFAKSQFFLNNLYN